MSRFSGKEDVNPMNYVSNLSDVMLILAVGIMLSLVLHWNVDIETKAEEQEESSGADAIEFNDSDLQDSNDLPDAAERMGNVYYDPETGKYYIIKDSGKTE